MTTMSKNFQFESLENYTANKLHYLRFKQIWKVRNYVKCWRKKNENKWQKSRETLSCKRKQQVCYWESQQVTLELNQTVWTLLYACGWIVISVDFRKVKPLRWSSRVRRNSEKLGNQDRQRKRLDKKAASSANLLTRSPSLEKWVHSHITHHWHYTLLQDLLFFPHSTGSLEYIVSKNSLVELLRNCTVQSHSG